MKVPVQQYLGETTVHGLVHFTGERKLYVKVAWLAVVLVSFTFCSFRVADVFKKFASKATATTVRENALDFEFPDVYICNESPISGSYSVTLNSQDSEMLGLYRRFANETMVALKGSILDPETELDNYAIRLVNSLPFTFLSDRMGQQKRQSIIFTYLEGNFDIVTTVFHHPSYLNCFSLNIPESNRTALRNPKHRIQLILFLDPPLPAPFDNSTEQDSKRFYGRAINLKPADWNLDYGTDFTVSAGFRFFLTPRGEYPSEMDAQIIAGPGERHRVVVRMQETAYSAEDFPDLCEAEGVPTADFINLYSGQRQTFKYSHSACWYRELARLSRDRYNCSVWRTPLTWEHRHLSSCFNLTEFHSDAVLGADLLFERTDLVDEARQACLSKAPCISRTYTYQYSSSSWPSRRVWREFLRTLVARWTQDEVASLPGIEYLLRNSSFEWAKESLLQIELSALSRKSQAVQLSLAYNFSSLIADVGGLLGLFLGMSLLSVLELLELLHDCSIVALKRAKLKWCCLPTIGVSQTTLSVDMQSTGVVS